MTQPLINKRQIIVLSILFLLIIFGCLNRWSYIILYGLTSYFFVIFAFTFIPSLRKLKINKLIRQHLLYVPLILPAIFAHYNLQLMFKIKILWLFKGIIAILIIMITNLKYYKYYLSKKNPLYTLPIDAKTFWSRVYFIILSVLCEELYFRLFLINFYYNLLGNWVILFGTFLFVLAHFVNRWATVTFSLKSYLYQSILSIILSLLFIYSGSFLVVFFSHIIYDIPEILSLYKRTKNSSNSYSFDDYN